ncbi:MGMT family protein, partial [Neisseria meningitidis]|uniref:MGMT family protein n=1 Tax=Neisseria meningitidis TaxID=487 RepID=UPI002F3579DD
LAIPYGETRSYKEQAQRLGNPKAVRAVAAANGHTETCIPSFPRTCIPSFPRKWESSFVGAETYRI